MDLNSRYLKAIEGRGLSSVSNSTRWTMLFESLAQYEASLEASVKWIHDENPSAPCRWIIPVPGYLEHLRLGPILFREIEWFEICTVEVIYRGALVDSDKKNHMEFVLPIVEKSKVMYTYSKDKIRIWGYVNLSSLMSDSKPVEN